MTTPPDNPESSGGEHSDNPDNLLDKKNNEDNEIIDFSPPSICIDEDGDAASKSGKGFKQTMPQGVSQSSEVKQNNVDTKVPSTDNQNSGEVSVSNKQSMGAKRKLVVGDRCEYCGNDLNLHQQYSVVLVQIR